MRCVLVVFGLVFEAVIFFLGAIVYFGWILAPAIIAACFVYGIKFLF